MSGKHPSHVTRISDASTFDEICVNCGATDQVPGGWGSLAKPCPNVPAVTCEDPEPSAVDQLAEVTREDKRKAARLAFFCADLGLIDCPGGGEWADCAWSVAAMLDAAKSGAEEADALSDAELDELFP